MDSSGLTLNRSTIEERNTKLYHSRFLYLLLAIQIGLALLFSAWLEHNPTCKFAQFFTHWAVTLVCGLLCLLIALLCYFLSLVRREPINWIIYGLFTVLFTIFVGGLLARDQNSIIRFVLWVIFAVALALFFYFLIAENYISSIGEILLIFGCAALVLLFFLISTDIEPWKLALAFIIATAIAFFISYQHRSMLKNSLWDLGREDPVTGAVRVWLDSLLGFCRIGELFTKGFGRFDF